MKFPTQNMCLKLGLHTRIEISYSKYVPKANIGPYTNQIIMVTQKVKMIPWHQFILFQQNHQNLFVPDIYVCIRMNTHIQESVYEIFCNKFHARTIQLSFRQYGIVEVLQHMIKGLHTKLEKQPENNLNFEGQTFDYVHSVVRA